MGRGAAHVLDVDGEGAAGGAAVVGDVGELLAVGADGGDEDVAGGGELGAVAEGEGLRLRGATGAALPFMAKAPATAATSAARGEADPEATLRLRAAAAPVRDGNRARCR